MIVFELVCECERQGEEKRSSTRLYVCPRDGEGEGENLECLYQYVYKCVCVYMYSECVRERKRDSVSGSAKVCVPCVRLLSMRLCWHVCNRCHSCENDPSASLSLSPFLLSFLLNRPSLLLHPSISESPLFFSQKEGFKPHPSLPPSYHAVPGYLC